MRKEEQSKYEDILYLPHPVSARHPQMSLQDRAAQFSPFAALTGHDAAIRETARLTDSFVELDEERKEQLDQQLRFLLSRMAEDSSQELEIKATYFQPDTRKSGGAYVSVCGKVKKYDRAHHQLLFTDGTTLPIENLFSMEGDLFKGLDYV